MLTIFLQAQQQGGGSMMFIMMAVMLVGFYFLMLRPQMKKQKQEKNFQESIKPGTRVVTTSGMHGKIVNVMEDGVIIETMSGKLKFEKGAISREFTEARFGDKKAPAAKETPKENKVKEVAKEEKENVTVTDETETK
ncbi:preprotein translocase subunit YajC [Elizabethkingia anophelis]|uniref:preprotein translocase subunit YajC n=1 Tax=Elizabethkingia anophelis TaxID=1117645 RepID=UPI0013708B06|nr:preprotein translocase subunit YajC [Elizabethkingia anophelis]MYY48207.1 preprotein translocase subunit YajC [Elizabethkingia anophelis]